MSYKREFAFRHARLPGIANLLSESTNYSSDTLAAYSIDAYRSRRTSCMHRASIVAAPTWTGCIDARELSWKASWVERGKRRTPRLVISRVSLSEFVRGCRCIDIGVSVAIERQKNVGGAYFDQPRLDPSRAAQTANHNNPRITWISLAYSSARRSASRATPTTCYFAGRMYASRPDCSRITVAPSAR